MLLILVPSFAKRIATRILLTARLNERKELVLRSCVFDMNLPSKNITCSKLSNEAQNQSMKAVDAKERRH